VMLVLPHPHRHRPVKAHVLFNEHLFIDKFYG